VTPSSLSLTEAGRLALFSARPAASTLPRISQANTTLSKPITKVVTLNSKPVAPAPASTLAKAPRVIKLTPAQFAAIKRGKASGQIVLPALSSAGGRRETITLRNPEARGPGIQLASPVPRKVPRVELQTGGEDKAELQRRLQRELEEKERWKDRYRQEMQKKEQETERIKAQLKALSS
jgi:hypothetical protein